MDTTQFLQLMDVINKMSMFMYISTCVTVLIAIVIIGLYLAFVKQTEENNQELDRIKGLIRTIQYYTTSIDNQSRFTNDYIQDYLNDIRKSVDKCLDFLADSYQDSTRNYIDTGKAREEIINNLKDINRNLSNANLELDDISEYCESIKMLVDSIRDNIRDTSEGKNIDNESESEDENLKAQNNPFKIHSKRFHYKDDKEYVLQKKKLSEEEKMALINAFKSKSKND